MDVLNLSSFFEVESAGIHSLLHLKEGFHFSKRSMFEDEFQQ